MVKVIVHTQTGNIVGMVKEGRTLGNSVPNIAPEDLHKFKEADIDVDVENIHLYKFSDGKVVPKDEAKLILAVKEIQQILINRGETLKNLL